MEAFQDRSRIENGYQVTRTTETLLMITAPVNTAAIHSKVSSHLHLFPDLHLFLFRFLDGEHPQAVQETRFHPSIHALKLPVETELDTYT